MNPFLLGYLIAAAIWMLVNVVMNYESLQTASADRVVLGVFAVSVLWPIHLLLFVASLAAFIWRSIHE